MYFLTTGKYIRWLRLGNNQYKRKYSQAEIGQMLNPPVNRSAINKWESGLIKNIKKSYIEQLAEIFGVTPTDLMCFGSKYNEERISEELKVIEEVQITFGKDFAQLLQCFNELNEAGKQKALEDIGNLTELAKYVKSTNEDLVC